MVKNYSKSQIYQLLENYLSLFQSQWGDDKDLYCDSLQQQIFQYEKDILDIFGLPLNSDCYLFLFDKATLYFLQQHDLAWLYTQLSIKAELYFQNNCKHRIISGSNANPFIIFPEFGIPVNSYTVFLYNQMQQNNTTQGIVWKEFAILKKTNKITEIYLLCFDNNYHKNNLFHILIEEGLHLLPAYLKWYHAKKEIGITLSSL